MIGKDLERLTALLGEPPAIPERDLIDAIRDEFPQYFWFIRDGKDTHWACEACGATGTMTHAGRGRPDVPKHKDAYTCPACGRNGMARNEMVSRTGMVEDMLATTWHRGSDGETLIARTWYAVLDRRAAEWDCMGDGYLPPWRAEPEVTLWGVCAINGMEHTAKRWERSNLHAWEGPIGKWVRRRTWRSCMGAAYGRFGGLVGHQIDGIFWDGQLEEALQGTSVGDAWGAIAEEFADQHSPDCVTELGNIARDRQVEYMIKGGFIDLAVRAVAGQSLRGLVNRRGKTASAMLRIPAHEIKWARKLGVEIDMDYLIMRDRLMKAGIGGTWTPAEISELSEQVDDWRWRLMLENLPASMRRKALRYCLRLSGRAERGLHPRATFGLLADYWRDSAALGRDLTDEREALPRDLERRHAEDQRRLRHAGRPENDRNIAARVPRWEKQYAFSYDGLVLRPALSSRELIDEGERQHICVGSYVDRYAAGKTVIMLLRERERLDEPWRTVEICPATGRVVQDRGACNDAKGIAPETKKRLAAFWHAWENRGRKTA